MHSFGFLLSRRWILFALAVGLLGYGTVWLGQWQFDRLEDRKASNSVVRTNEGLDPEPVSEVLSVAGKVSKNDEWRLVSATGTYAVEDTVVIRYRSRDGVPGVDAVVPLVLADGTALLVDRGFWPSKSRNVEPVQIPGPPEGSVDVTGWVRADGTGDSTQVDNRSARAISSVAIGEALQRQVFGGFVELASESPEPGESLARVELPELDNGPHFFYGLQWWFFTLLALFGFCYLAYDEWKRGPRGERSGGRKSSVDTSPQRTGSSVDVS